MPFDAVLLRAVRQELQSRALGAKIDKVQQPERDAIVLQLRSMGGGGRLLLCASPNRARIHFTEAAMENPSSPPMFCMLLRKHLVGGKLVAIEQPEMERALTLHLECTDEMGEPTQKRLIVELMGRNSNVILVDAEGRIVDALRRVDYEMSEKRQVLPGLFYHEPPQQEKLDPLALEPGAVAGMLQNVRDPIQADKWLLDHFAGLSPLVCRELSWRFCARTDADLSRFTLPEREHFAALLEDFFQTIREEKFTPVLLEREGTPSDFSYTKIGQYESYMTLRNMESFSQLLDAYYARRDQAERMRQKGQSLHKSLQNLRDRTARKLGNQRRELAAAQDRERLRQLGDLVTANLHGIVRGQPKLRCMDFYDPDGAEVEIPLNVTLSPQQNAAKYYKDYTKAKNAEKILREQIASGEAELAYFESVLDAMSRAESEKDLTEIRQELTEGGYLRQQGGKKGMKSQPSRPMEFRSSEGEKIYVGRNNRQNDLLTLKTAYKGDVWLHTQKIHGSHVIIACSGHAPGERTLEEAAKLAAYYSQARQGQNVPVDYTQVRNVKKPAGAKPGMVIYDHYNTLYVKPSEELAEELREK